MQIELTAALQKVPEGSVGFIEELPGANTQAATLEEARDDVREAAVLVLEANRTLAREGRSGRGVLRERLKLSPRSGSTGSAALNSAAVSSCVRVATRPCT